MDRRKQFLIALVALAGLATAYAVALLATGNPELSERFVAGAGGAVFVCFLALLFSS